MTSYVMNYEILQYIPGAGVVSIDDSDSGADGGGRVGVNAVSLVVRPRAPAKFLKIETK